MKEFLHGRQPVLECLRARRRHVFRLLLSDVVREAGIVGQIVESARGLGVPVVRVPRTKMDAVSETHQGVALEVGAYPYVAVADILRRALKLSEQSFVLALDHVQDPHNLGALLRTADAVGVHGVVVPERRAAGVSPAVVSASAGASEHVQVAQVTNLVRCLEALKDDGLWVVGLDSSHTDCLLYHEVDLNRPLVLVVGAEGEGLSHLARQSCDLLVRLPMRGRLESLNASVAGGVAMYAAWGARGFAGN